MDAIDHLLGELIENAHIPLGEGSVQDTRDLIKSRKVEIYFPFAHVSDLNKPVKTLPDINDGLSTSRKIFRRF